MPGRRGVRLNVRHPCCGKRRNQPSLPDQRSGLVLRAPVAGKKAVIRFDDLRWHQPFEQVLDAGADGACGYLGRPARLGAWADRQGSGSPLAMQSRIKGPRRVGRGGNALVAFS
jgi:hypothetical protein